MGHQWQHQLLSILSSAMGCLQDLGLSLPCPSSLTAEWGTEPRALAVRALQPLKDDEILF